MPPRSANTSSLLVRWSVTLLRTTLVVERLYRMFDRARSTLVLMFSSDQFLEAYNSVAYGVPQNHRAGFRVALFDWEEAAVKRFFPPPPARVLVGGAGSGREAFALAEVGYTVVAFEPVDSLVREMRVRQSKQSGDVRAYRGAYRDMPLLGQGDPQGTVDLREERPFDAAIIGWGSFSHLVTDAERTMTLRRFAGVTRGPILASFYPAPTQEMRATRSDGVRGWVRRRATRRGTSRFSLKDGYCRLLTATEFEALAAEASLDVLHLDCTSVWAHALVSAPSQSTFQD